MRNLNSKYSFLILVLVALAFACLMLPILGSKNGIEIFLDNFSQSTLRLKLLFVWFFRFIIIFLTIFPVLAIIVSRWGFSFITICLTGLSTIFCLMLIWSGNSIYAKQTLISGDASPKYGLFILLIISLVSFYAQARILFDSESKEYGIKY